MIKQMIKKTNLIWFSMLALVMVIGITSATITDTGTITTDSIVTTTLSSTNISADNINSVLYVEAGNGSDIQTKIDMCPSSGCKVILPLGTYIITNPIIMNVSSVILQGEGLGSIITGDFDNSYITTNGDTTEFIQIKDLYLLGSGIMKGEGINTSNSRHFKIENVQVRNFQIGITLPLTFYGVIDNIKVRSCNVSLDVIGNSNTFLGGRIYPYNSEEIIGVKLSGDGNRFYGLDIEKPAGTRNGTSFYITGSQNLLSGTWHENLNVYFNLTSTAEYNKIISSRMAAGALTDIDDNGIDTTVITDSYSSFPTLITKNTGGFKSYSSTGASTYLLKFRSDDWLELGSTNVNGIYVKNDVYLDNDKVLNVNVIDERDGSQINITSDVNITGLLQAEDYFSGDGSQGITDSSSYWLCTAADCSTKCQAEYKDGLLTGCS